MCVCVCLCVCVCVCDIRHFEACLCIKIPNAFEAGIVRYTPVTGLDISGLEVDLPRADYIVELV